MSYVLLCIISIFLLTSCKDEERHVLSPAFLSVSNERKELNRRSSHRNRTDTLQQVLKSFKNAALNGASISEKVTLLSDALRRTNAEWVEAMNGLRWPDIYYSTVEGSSELSADKALLEEEVRSLQAQLGSCGGHAVVPRTFRLEDESQQRAFCEHAISSCGQRNPVWVTKIKGGYFGQGISECNLAGADMKACVDRVGKHGMIQRLVEKPLMVDGRKVEIRFHVLIASVDPWLVLYHPDFIVKHATRKDVFLVNTHKQKLEALSPEELMRAMGKDDTALLHIHAQLKWIAWLSVMAHRKANGFQHAQPGQWELLGLDVALTQDLRAFLLDWNTLPGLGLCNYAEFCYHGSQSSHRQSAATIRDMYYMAFHAMQGERGDELGARIKETAWEPVIDETQGKGDPLPACAGDWLRTQRPDFLQNIASWRTDSECHRM